MDNEQTNFSSWPSDERYYTEHVRVPSDEDADNELVQADIIEKIREKTQRGWRLVKLTPGPGVDTVELKWDTSGGSGG